jgi:ferredoxin-thioredoxin reductase catalytic subunit
MGFQLIKDLIMTREEAKKLMTRLQREAEQSGYLLNPDEEMVLDLMEGLIANEKRFGYWACPCMEADGSREKDLDIICPCDYRDADLDGFGACYCALYVSEDVAAGRRPLKSIPLRRPPPEEREIRKGKKPETPAALEAGRGPFSEAAVPVWRCPVCGYLCARPEPPLKCPICKVDKDRFEPFV